MARRTIVWFGVLALTWCAPAWAQVAVDYTAVERVFADDFNSKAQRYGNPNIVFEYVAPAVLIQTGKGVYTVQSQKRSDASMLYYPDQDLVLPEGEDRYLRLSFILDRFTNQLTGKGDLKCSARFFLTPVSAIKAGQFAPFTAPTTLSMFADYKGKKSKLELSLYEKTEQKKPGRGRLLYKGACAASSLPLRCDIFVGQERYIVSFSEKVYPFAGSPAGRHGVYKAMAQLPSRTLRTGIRIVNHIDGVRAQMVVDDFQVSVVKVEKIQSDVPEKTASSQRFDVSADPTWKRVWEDEFDGTALDTRKWQVLKNGPYDLGEGWPKGYARKENVSLDGKGHAVIKFSRDEHGDLVVGRMKSTSKFLYGYFEARLKLSKEPGWWAAFWLMKDAPGANPFLHGLEIDIFEDFFKKVRKENIVQHALHTGIPSAYGKSFTSDTLVENWDAFHVFGLKWTPLDYVIYIDGVEVLRWNKHHAITTQPCCVRLSSSTGSVKKAAFTGDYRDAHLPDYFVIDYVRVYEKDHAGKKKPQVTWVSPGPDYHRAVKEDDSVTLEATTTDPDGDVREVNLFDNGYLLATKTKPPYRFAVTFNNAWFSKTDYMRPANLRGIKSLLTQHVFVVTATDNDHLVGTSKPKVFYLERRARSRPYRGKAQRIPGRVELEYFDEGGQGVAYNDADKENTGTTAGKNAFRINQGVDTGGKSIGWVYDGEWLRYTLHVTRSGTYSVTVPLAAGPGAPEGQDKGVWLEMDGRPIAELTMKGATGGWGKQVPVTQQGVTLTRGTHVLTVRIVGGFVNLDYLDFRLQSRRRRRGRRRR